MSANNLFLIFFILLHRIGKVSGLGKDAIGTLTQSGYHAVDNSITNTNEYADFKFTFKPTTALEAGSTLVITFPIQFDEGLGIAGNPVCQGGTCTLSVRTVTVTLTSSSPAAADKVVIVEGVKNPISSSGTGNFELFTMKGENIIDENKVFSVIGVADTVQALTFASVKITSGFSTKVGAISNLTVTFRIEAAHPKNFWVRVKFPSTSFFVAAIPTCVALPVTGRTITEVLTCALEGTDTIKVTGYSEELPKLSFISFSFPATNPSYASTTGTFEIRTGRETSNTILGRKKDVAGITVTPSDLNSVEFAALNSTSIMARNKPMQYRLSFVTASTIEAGGSITVKFNDYFNMDGLYDYYLESDLDNSPATLTYSAITKTLTVKGMNLMVPRIFSLILLIQNASTAGATSPLVISTLNSKGNNIDQDSTKATITTASMTSPTISVSYPGANSNKATGSSIQITFSITPNTAVPAQGYIKLRLPSGFEVTSNPLTCTVKPSSVGSDNASDCAYIDGYIYIQLFTSTSNAPSGAGTFLINTANSVTISAGLKCPNYSDTFYFDLETLDPSKNKLESGTAQVTLIAQDLNSVTFSSLHSELDTISVQSFAFTVPSKVPSGATPATIKEDQGFIEVTLPTADNSGNALFRTDLGLGMSLGDLVSCKGKIGLSAATASSSLKCQVTTKPAFASGSTPVVITVSNFAEIASGTAVVLELAGIKNVQTANAPSILVKIYKINLRQRFDLAQMTASGTTGASTSVTNSNAVTWALTSTQTQMASVGLSGTLTNTVASGATSPRLMIVISPTHDKGFCVNYLTVTCSIGGSSYSCRCFDSIDIVVIDLTASLTAASRLVSISGLTNPESVPTSVDGLTAFVIGSGNLVETITTSGLATLTPGTFTQTTLTVDKTNFSAVNSVFTFGMKTTSIVPSGGYFKITFPSGLYSLHNSSPLPTCSVTGLNALTSSGFSCSAYSNTATIGNFQQLAGGSAVTLIVSGVKHPSSGSGTFTYETLNASSRTIDKLTGITGVTYTAAETPSTLSVTVEAIPSNSGVVAEYAVTFTPSRVIPVGGLIHVTFPSNLYGVVPNPPTCRVSGNIKTFKACTASGSTTSVTLDKVSSLQPLTVHIFGIKNPSAGSTSSFTIKTEYDGLTLEQSDSSEGTMAVITAEAAKMSVKSLVYYPMNEGEVATYEFTIEPSLDMAENARIVIAFPESYDRFLGKQISCWATNLVGYTSCEIAHAYELHVIKHGSFKACQDCNFTIHVHGVINPNRKATKNTGEFRSGILSGRHFLQYNEKAGSVDISSAPGVINLHQLSYDNLYARYQNIFNFNFTAPKSVPKVTDLGAVWVHFPTDYLLEDSKVACSTSSSWSSPSCEVYKERVILTGNSQAFVGDLQLKLSNAPNPLFEGLANALTVETYNGYSRLVLDRTYENLYPVRLTYSFPGPLITVNRDLPAFVERGTMSDFIPITLDFPCALNLTLTPTSEGFTFIPNQIQLYTGDIKATFRISVPSTSRDETYVIVWAISGERSPPYYTPIQKSTFTVTKNLGISVLPTYITPVIKGASSLPTQITLANAPDRSLLIYIEVVDRLTGITVYPEILEFPAGTLEGYFTVHASNSTTITSGNVKLRLAGVNAQSYSIKGDTLGFSILATPSQIPSDISVAVLEKGRNYAALQLSSAVNTYVFYQIALKGSPTPNFTEVETGGPPYFNTTQAQYGKTYIDALTQVNVTGLVAASDYAINIWARDALGRVSSKQSNQTFSTLPISKPAEFSLTFLSSYMNAVERESVKSIIRLILSLHDWRLVEKSATVVKTGVTRRRLQNVLTVIKLQIVDSPFNPNYPKPVQLVERLIQNKAYLKKFIPTFDSNADIPYSEMTDVACSYLKEPYLLGTSNYNSISVAAKLEFNGTTYAIAVPAATDGGVASTNQVVSGLDFYNKRATQKIVPMASEELTNFTFAGLTPNKDYNLYIVCGNSLPVFPDYSTEVFVINWKTDSTPSREAVVTDGDIIQAFVWALVLLVVS